MKLDFYYGRHFQEWNPKFALDWIYYNADPERIARRNRYREKISLPKILDGGRDFSFSIYIGSYIFSIIFIIRKLKFEETSALTES